MHRLKFKYQTVNFDVNTGQLLLSRKFISCDPLNETIRIEAGPDCSPFHKRQRSECTSRSRQNLFGSRFEKSEVKADYLENSTEESFGPDVSDIDSSLNENSTAESTGSPVTDIDNRNDAILDKMSKLLPTVICELSKVDKIDGLLHVASYSRQIPFGKYRI